MTGSYRWYLLVEATHPTERQPEGQCGNYAKDLDGAIIDPLDKKMMANIITAEALAGRDEYCMNYLKAFRAGHFK